MTQLTNFLKIIFKELFKMDIFQFLPKGPLTPLLIAGTLTTLGLAVIIKYDTVELDFKNCRFRFRRTSNGDGALQITENN